MMTVISNRDGIVQEVKSRERILTIGGFYEWRIELSVLLLENGRTAYGCHSVKIKPEEQLPRQSKATEIYTERGEALSEAYVNFIALNPPEDGGMSYVARKKCGCIVGAIVSDGGRDVEGTVNKWFKSKLIIDRVTHEQVREGFTGWECPHEMIQASLL